MPNDLLSVVHGNTSRQSLPKSTSATDNPFNLSPAVYTQPADSDSMLDKISQLNQITSKYAAALFTEMSGFDSSRFKVDYSNRLNKSQFHAVISTKGPLLVIAGAGTGKTHVVVHRVSYLIENNVMPARILLLTFTRKAAQEMLNRVNALLGSTSGNKVTGGTFHAFATRALRKFGNILGFDPGFTIIDEADAVDVVDIVRGDLNLGQSNKDFPKKDRIHQIISASRNRTVEIKAIIELEFTGLIRFIPDIIAIARGYQEYKRKSLFFDFDDLMEVLRNGLKDNEVFRRNMQESFDFIMVDEYQDTNLIQKEIVDLLGSSHRNIMVVGDDAQSIYAFRGSNYENILRFPETYPDCQVVKLEENYRSHQGLLDFTNELISHAVLGFRKTLFSKRITANKPVVAKFYSSEDEARSVTDCIIKLKESGIKANQIAVLCRSSWQWQGIEKELMVRRIPYVTVGGVKFNEKSHIKDVLSYLRVIYNRFDTIAWQRLLRLLPGIGKVTATRLVSLIQATGGKMNPGDFASRKFYESLKNLTHHLTQASQRGIGISLMIQDIMEHYAPILKEREEDHETRMLDIQVLTNYAQDYKSLGKFLEDFTLEPPTKKFGEFTPKTDESEEPPLTLSTIHSAKGLEWSCVFVPSCLDGQIPSNRGFNSTEELEEERRLMYVACTRAKEYLFLTMPSILNSFGGFFSLPSRFLTNLNPTLYDFLTTVEPAVQETLGWGFPKQNQGFLLTFDDDW